MYIIHIVSILSSFPFFHSFVSVHRPNLIPEPCAFIEHLIHPNFHSTSSLKREYALSLNTAPGQYPPSAHIYKLLCCQFSSASAMATLLTLATLFIAMMDPFISRATGKLAALALVVTLSTVIALLFLQKWTMGDGKGNEVVEEDAKDIVRASFTAMARDPGASSASFCVANGVVTHRSPATGVPSGGDEPANGMELERMGPGSRDPSKTDAEGLEPWPELSHASDKRASSSSSSSRNGPADVKRLGGLWVPIQSTEGVEMISRMV